MSYKFRYISYKFRFRAYIFRNIAPWFRKLLTSLKLKFSSRKKCSHQHTFVAIAGFGLFSETTQLNLKFCLYLWTLGNITPLLLQAWERCVQHIFRTYAESFSPIFSERILLKLLPKILRESWKPNRPLSIKFVLKLRFRENQLWN